MPKRQLESKSTIVSCSIDISFELATWRNRSPTKRINYLSHSIPLQTFVTQTLSSCIHKFGVKTATQLNTKLEINSKMGGKNWVKIRKFLWNSKIVLFYVLKYQKVYGKSDKEEEEEHTTRVQKKNIIFKFFLLFSFLIHSSD